LQNRSNKKYINTLYILIILFISDDTVLFGSNQNKLFISIKFAVILAALAFLIISSFFRKNTIILNWQHLILVFCIVFSGLINNDIRSGYLYEIILIILGLLFAQKIHYSTFVLYYNRLIYISCLGSIALYLAYNYLFGIMRYLPKIVNIKNLEFYNIYIAVLATNTYKNIIRFQGVFREPGVFQMFIILSLINQWFYLKKVDIKKSTIMIISIIASLSTTGYIALLILIIILIIYKDINKKDKIKVLLVVTTLLTFIVFSTNIFSRASVVFNKLFQTENESTNARLASIIVNLKMALESPLFGIGLTKVDESFSKIAYETIGKYSFDNTNMILYKLSTHGIIFTIVFSIGWFRYTKIISRNKIVVFGIIIVILIIFSGENLPFSPIIYVLFSYGVLSRKKKIEKESFYLYNSNKKIKNCN
jgi:hypothetical protein